MTTTQKPVITLKNIKHSAMASHETYCYSATIYVDGKRFATVENRGWGGPDKVIPITGGREGIEALDKQIKATYPPRKFEEDYTIEADLEVVCGELVHEWLLKKELKRVMRRISYVKPDTRGVYQLPAKHKPTLENLRAVKKASWAKDATFLHDMTEAEALETYKNNI